MFAFLNKKFINIVKIDKLNDDNKKIKNTKVISIHINEASKIKK